MNRDGQGSTKYKHPCISENIFLQSFSFYKENKTKKHVNFGFPLADCQGDRTAPSYRCYVNVPSFQTTLLKSQVTTPGTVSVESSAVHGYACLCWDLPCCSCSLQQGCRDAGSFSWADSCANLWLQLPSAPAVSHLRNFLPAVSPLVPGAGCRKKSS